MGKKKNFAAAVVCVMVMELAGCAGGNEQEPSASIPMEEVSTGNDNEVQNRTEDNMQQKETETQEAFSRNEEDMRSSSRCPTQKIPHSTRFSSGCRNKDSSPSMTSPTRDGTGDTTG